MSPLPPLRRRRHRYTVSIKEEEGKPIASAIEEDKLKEEDNNGKDEDEEERSCVTAIGIIKENERLIAAVTVELPQLRMEMQIHQLRDR
jgi:hypothetical protein